MTPSPNEGSVHNDGPERLLMIVDDSGESAVHDDNDTDDTSKTSRMKSTQRRPSAGKHLFNRSVSSLGYSCDDSIVSFHDSTISKERTSNFEINCSPAKVSVNGRSNFDQMRRRRKKQEKQQEQQQNQQQQQQQQQQNEQEQEQEQEQDLSPQDPIPSNSMTNKEIARSWRRPSKILQQEELLKVQEPITPDGTEKNLIEEELNGTFHTANLTETIHPDDSSYFTINDSAGSFNPNDSDSQFGYNETPSFDDVEEDDDEFEEDVLNDSISISNTTYNPSVYLNDALSAATSLNSMSLGSTSMTISKGEEHTISRMKKYGLVNLHELKRKKLLQKQHQQQQQHRGVVRTISGKGAASPGSLNGGGKPSLQQQQPSKYTESPLVTKSVVSMSNYSALTDPITLTSGLTEGLTASVGPGLSNNGGGAAAGQPKKSKWHDRQPAVDVPSRIRTVPQHVQMAVEEIHRWLFTEGGHFEDVEMLMTQYSLYVREHFGIPLDRLYYGGIGLHPKLTAYLWKWEAHGEFTHSEMPPHIFARRNEIFSPDEPFCVMEQGRAEHVRIRDTDSYIPPDTAKWFRKLNYKDYFALPDIHRGVSKGGIAWATKCPDGFCEDDVQFFRMTHAAMTTIMRLHTNDLVLNTLTERMEAEIEDRTNDLAIANDKLEDANNEISRHAAKQLEHFACMSHEIRTPLNCIVGLSSLLLENDDLNDDLLDTINMVYNSADLVQGVVNDVLDYAKIESGHFELDVRPSDLQTTMNGVVHSISNKLKGKNVQVRTSYSGKLGRMMTTDRRRLQQILYNILGNAAKFSREDTTIDFRVMVLDADKSKPYRHTVRFSIKDYGKGIEEKNFEKIFQPFSQASKETQTVYGGTGLGLSITRNLVQRLGGNISIKSEINKFTEMIVDIPYREKVMDGSKYKEKLSETTIVILDPSTDADGDDDENPFLPIPKDVIDLYGLTVIRCSSWGELESRLRLRDNAGENYVVLAHEDMEDLPGMVDVEKMVRKEDCSWFSFGTDGVVSNNHQRQYHFRSLTGMFPSTLLDKISEGILAQREQAFTFGGSCSLESSRGGSSLVHDEDHVPQLQLEDTAAARQGPLHNMSQSVLAHATSPVPPTQIISTINNADLPMTPLTGGGSKKKLTIKYPPRDLKLLIADDNPINQKVLERILKRLGVTNVTIVDNGKKAVDISARKKFDCIFMDMEMPVMGGLEACRLITERDHTNSKVTFVTAHDIEDIREKADEAGAYGYLAKPLKLKEVHECLVILEESKKAAAEACPDDASRQQAMISDEEVAKDSATLKSVKYARRNSLRGGSRKGSSHGSLKANSSHDELKQGSSHGLRRSSSHKRSTALKPKKKRKTKVYPKRSIKVLVAEDNVINQKVLDRILKRVGVSDITIVDNGLKAVHASEAVKFDCILMDMQMPVMDGLEACRAIEKRNEEQGIEGPKIVFVTAHALVEFREKAIAAGAFDFITKPFKMEDIDNVLKIVELTSIPSPNTASTAASDDGSCSSEDPLAMSISETVLTI